MQSVYLVNSRPPTQIIQAVHDDRGIQNDGICFDVRGEDGLEDEKVEVVKGHYSTHTTEWTRQAEIEFEQISRDKLHTARERSSSNEFSQQQ